MLQRQQLADTEAAINAYSMYLLAQENNPHPIYGDTFREALTGFESVERKMRPFLAYLQEHAKLIQPRPKSQEEIEAEEMERIQQIQEERDRQAAAQKEQLGNLFGSIKHRLDSAPPGAPGMPAVLSYDDHFVRVPAEPAKTFDQEVLDDLDDKMRSSGTGGLTSSELAEYCAMTIRGEHSELYCFEIGENSLKQAKALRFQGELDAASTAVTRAHAAFGHAGARAQQHSSELEFLQKQVAREVSQLNKGMSCQELARKAIMEGNLVVFRRYWNDAKSLYESCGAVAKKQEYLPTLLEWDEQVRHQEKDVKDMTDAISATRKALEDFDMVVAAQQVQLANLLIEKCGKAGVELGAQARELLQTVRTTLDEQRKQQEALCKSAIITEKFSQADNAVVQIWKCCRLVAIAQGDVSSDAEDKALVASERKQAKVLGSSVLGLSEELAGTREQHSAVSILTEIDLLVWPHEESRVLDMKAKASNALAHITKGRKHLEAAASENSNGKILALQPIEMDLALRVHQDDVVKMLLSKTEGENPNGLPFNGIPYLCTAAAANNTGGLQMLLDSSGDVNLVDHIGNTPVHHAVQSKSWDALRALGKFRKTNPNKINEGGYSPLHLAVRGKASAPAGLNARSLLKKATKSFKNISAAGSLAEAITTAKSQTDSGTHVEAIRILLTDFWKINPNIKAGKYEATALHLAGELSNFEAQEILLQSTKIDPNVRDSRGRSALVATIWIKKDISRFLDCQRVDVNLMIPDKGWSPLHVCIVKNSLICMEALLKCDRVNPSAEDLCGYTAMHLALHAEVRDVIKTLLENKNVQDAGGSHLARLLEAVRRFHAKGDPSFWGLWTQASRELLELLPSLLLELRMWDQLHDVLCNVAFAAAMIENLGVDTVISLFAEASDQLGKFPGVRQEICHDFTQYQGLLEKFRDPIRTAASSFTSLAVEHHLWGVHNAQHSVSHIVEEVDTIRGEVASKTKKEKEAFFECLAYKEEMHKISKVSLDKILPSKRSFERAVQFMTQLYTASECTLEELDAHFGHAMQSVKHDDALSQETAIDQLASLYSITKNQDRGSQERGMALRVQMKQTIDISKIKSRLCEALHAVLPNNEQHVLLRVVRIYMNLGKVNAVIVLSKNPVKTSLSFGEGRLLKSLNAIVDSFRGKSNDARLKPVIEELKILSITAIDPSVFVVLDIVAPCSTTKQFSNKQEFASQVLNDIRNASNLQPNLIRIAKVSQNWNSVVVELLHDDINPSKSLSKNRIMAERLVTMAKNPSTVLHKGVATQHIACCVSLEGHVVPRLEGEWQDYHVRVMGSSIAMHNELKLLDEIILPAAQSLALLHNSYVSWTVSQDDMMSPNMKKLGHDLHDMELHEAETEIIIGLVGDRYGSIVDFDGKKASCLEDELKRNFLQCPDWKEVFVFMRDLEGLEEAGFPHQYKKVVTDDDDPEPCGMLKSLKTELNKHNGRRTTHYKPTVKGFRLDVELVLFEAQEASNNWDMAKERLDRLKASAADSDGTSGQHAIRIVENRMQEMLESCGRWIKALRIEEQRGSVPSSIMEAANDLERGPMFEGQAAPKMDLSPDPSELRLALGLELDVDVDMFHVGLAVVDTVKARNAPIYLKPPFHSHLQNRELQENLRQAHANEMDLEEGSALHRNLLEMEAAICPASVERTRSTERVKSSGKIERARSNARAEKKPVVLLSGGPGAGKTATLAFLSKNILTARHQNDLSHEVPSVQIYFKMTNQHNFGLALRYLNLELAIQVEGRDGLNRHNSHMGDWEDERAMLKTAIEALPSGTNAVFLLDGFAPEHRQVMAELVLSLSDSSQGAAPDTFIQLVMCAEPGAVFKPNTVPEAQVAVFELGGLSQSEQSLMLSNFGKRFHMRDLSDAEKKHVLGNNMAQIPLYLNVYSLACIIKPGWVNAEFALPDNVAKLFELFVIPFLSDWVRVSIQVVEATLEVAQMNMRGIRLESMQLEVLGLLPQQLRGEASLSKIAMIISLVSPIWRKNRAVNGLIALEHPSLVDSLSGSASMAKLLHLGDSSLRPKSSQNKKRASITGSLDTEHVDPKLLERLRLLKDHKLELFNLHSTRPLFLALQSDENWELPMQNVSAEIGDEASFRALPPAVNTNESESGRSHDWQWAMNLRHGEIANDFSPEDLCHNGLAMDPCDAIRDKIAKWIAHAERILGEYELTDDEVSLKIEQQFDACYDQAQKVTELVQQLDDPDFAVAIAGLQMASVIWNVNEVPGDVGDAATTVDTDDAAFAKSISATLIQYQKMSASVLQQQKLLESKCWQLSDKLISVCQDKWDQCLLIPSKIRETLAHLVYDVIGQFRGEVELLYRLAVAQEKAGGDNSPWVGLTQGVIREACEDLSKSLNEDVGRICSMVAKKRETDFISGLALAQGHLQAQRLYEALDAFDKTRTCGRYPVELIDKKDPNNKEALLVELWTIKAQLDNACEKLATCVTTSQAFGPAFAVEDAIVGIPSLIIIQSKNKKGELLENGGEAPFWKIDISDKHGSVEFQMIDNANGTYEIKFVPRFEEGCKVSIGFQMGKRANVLPLPGSPFQLRFRRDSFWSLKTVAGMPRNLNSRVLFAASQSDAFLLDVYRKELHRFYPDDDADTNVWSCQKVKFATEDLGSRNLKGLFSVSQHEYVGYTDSLSPQYDGFADCCVSVEMDASNNLRVAPLLTVEEDFPAHVLEVFAPRRPWPWSSQSCKNVNKVAGVPELLETKQDVLQTPEHVVGTSTDGPNTKSLLRGDSILYDTALPGVEKAKFSKVAIKGSSNRYENFSLPIVVVSATADSTEAGPVGMLLTHYDQHSRAWRRRQSALFSDGKLVIFGGLGETSKLLSCYHSQDADTKKASVQFDLREPSGNIPSKRCNFFMAVSGKYAVLHGGIDENDRVLNDVYLYDLEHNRWERTLSLAIKNSVPSVYSAGAGGVLSLSRGTTHMQLRVLNLEKILRRSSLSMCGQLVVQTTQKARRAIRGIQAGLNRRDSWLLRLAVFRALDADIEPMLRNVLETMNYVELHEADLHSHDLTLHELHEDVGEAQQMYRDMVRVATELRSKLKKSPLPERPSIEHYCRVRAQHIKLYDISRNAEFTRVVMGHQGAIVAIEKSAKRLEEFQAECLTLEKQLSFYGDPDSMAEERSVIAEQFDLLDSFRKAWDLHRDLFEWAQMYLSHPDILDKASAEDMIERLRELKVDKMVSSELFCVLSLALEDTCVAQQFIDLLKLTPGRPEDAWLASRVLFALTRRVLHPATLATMLKERTFQEERVRDFIALAKKSSVDEAISSMVGPDAKILSRELKFATGIVEGIADKSMHSSTSYCEIKSIRRKRLEKRSAVRFHSRGQQQAVDPELRDIIGKARLGKLKEFKEIVDRDASLLQRTVDANGNTLVHIAAGNGQKKIFKELMRNAQKVDLYARDRKGRNALDLANEFKYSELAEYLQEKLPALAEPLQTPVEETPCHDTHKLHGIRLDFTLHGMPPPRQGGLTIPGGSAYLRTGTHSNFISYAPIKIKTNASGKPLESPVDVSVWFVVGGEAGPWVFSYGEGFTEISVEIPKLSSKVATSESRSHVLEQKPLRINLESDVANATVVQSMVAKGNSDSMKVHYSLSEFVAEVAFYDQRASEIKAVAARDGERVTALERHSRANESIVRDGMNRPLVVDGVARGICLSSVLSTYHRDALGRIVVTDGMERNAEVKVAQGLQQADWRSKLGYDGDDTESAEASPAIEGAEASPALAQMGGDLVPLSPTSMKALDDLTNSGQGLLEALPQEAREEILSSLVAGDALLAHALRARIESSAAPTTPEGIDTPTRAERGAGESEDISKTRGAVVAEAAAAAATTAAGAALPDAALDSQGTSAEVGVPGESPTPEGGGETSAARGGGGGKAV